MTRTELLNQFLILGAALLKESSNGDIHFEEQQAIIRDEILLNPMFAAPMTQLYKNNVVFNGEQGPIPTIKGWKSIQPKVVEVSKPFNRTRIPQEQLVPLTSSLMQEICYRSKNHPKFKPALNDGIEDLVNSYNCLNEVITDTVSNLTPVEVETPIEEVKTVKTSRKKKEVV